MKQQNAVPVKLATP